MMVTYKVGKELVTALKKYASWSLPFVVSSFGVFWGEQVSIYLPLGEGCAFHAYKIIFVCFDLDFINVV
jgi:hypothetical protein